MKLTREPETTAAPVTRVIPAEPRLPALKTLGDLADLEPVVIVDTREQTPLPFYTLKNRPGTLTTGDYSFAGGQDAFAVERKSIADLVGCCMGDNRDRFERELHRLRGFWFKRLLVVGRREEIESGEYRSAIRPASVLGTLAAFEVRYEVPVVFIADPETAGKRVEEWIYWAARELVERVNRIKRESRQG
jgi:DNA excision repair protein ERCC-4